MLIHAPMDERQEEDRRLLQEVKLLLRDYWPHPILEFSGYISTFYSGFWAVMPSLHGTGRLETVTLRDGGEVSLHWYDPPEQPWNRILLVLPGLNNDSRTSFVQATMRHLRSEGFQAVALNYRGLTNELKTPKVACAAAWEDVQEVTEHIRRRYLDRDLFGLGFSLGGAILLRHLGENGCKTLFKAAVTVAAPVDLPATMEALESSRRKRLMNFMVATGAKSFMFKGVFNSKYRRQIDVRKVMLATQLRQLDEAVLCPLMGYESSEAYHEANSPRPHLQNISVPTLVVNAEDDPVVSISTIPFDELKRRSAAFPAVLGECLVLRRLSQSHT